MNFAAGVAITRDITLVRPLRSGAMGRVWVAAHAGLRREIAVKFMGQKMAKDRAMLARFNREAEAAAQINSPHVVKIVEHGTTDSGVPFIAMELLKGESLGERLERDNRLALDLCASILRQVGSALDAAHARGIVHRDIKPDNLFLVTGGRYPVVKVLDFGMAKQVREHSQSVTATGVAVGTPEYMSPEQVLGAKDVDFRSDLWALAVVAYNMITGEPAFSAATPHALFFTICKGSFTPLARHDAPLDFTPWFERAFQPAKEKRFGSAREMVLRFEAYVSAARAADDDESTQMIPPADKLRVLESFGKDAPESQTNPRYSAPDSGSVDHLASTIDLGKAGFLGEIDDHDTDDDDDDSFPTQQVSKGEAARAIREALENFGNPMGAAPDSETTLRSRRRDKTMPMAIKEDAGESVPKATIDLGVSGYDNTVHSSKSPFGEDGDPGLPPDDSVPGLTKPRPPQHSDAPIDSYPDVTDADASGPRPALASHSPESSGARVSVSARQAEAITAQGSSSATPRAAASPPKRKANTWLTVAALSIVAAGVIFVVTSQKRTAPDPASALAVSSTSVEEPSAATAVPTRSDDTNPASAAAAPVDTTPPTGSATASPADARTGTISITCIPQCINIRLNEEILGPSPLLNREVAAGTHRFTLLRQGMSPSVVEVEVEAGRHVTRSFNLTAPTTASPTPDPLPSTAKSSKPDPTPVEDPYANETLPTAPGESAPPPLPVP